MNMLFFGPPGSGKGTQAQNFSGKKLFGRRPAAPCRHISTGDIFRRHLKRKTALGKAAQKYIDAGRLVPDSVTVGMAGEALDKTPLGHHVIFDGFPRNIPQARALGKMLKKRGQKLDLAVFFDVSDKAIAERLSGRLWAPKSGQVYHIKNNPPKTPGFCDETGEALVSRKDDQKEVIISRLRAYRESTLPLLAYYEKKGILRKIRAARPPDKIREEICRLAFPEAL